MNSVLTLILTFAGKLLYRLGLAPLVIGLRRGTPRVVVYHGCERTESAFLAGLQSNTTPDELAAHLEFYQRFYTVIDVTQLEQGPIPDRCLAITFDDGYRSVGENAWPLLRALGLPATIYLVADTLTPGRLVWVNELNWYLRRYPAVALPVAREGLGVPDSSSADEVMAAAVARYDKQVIDNILATLRTSSPAHPTEEEATTLYLSRQDVRALAMDGARFGNHTATHPNLRLIDGETLRAELACAQAGLAESVGSITSLAYPFGEASDDVRATATRLGFRSLAEIGGSNRPFNPHRLGRVPVTAPSAAGAFAQVELVEPAKALVRRLVRAIPRP